MVKALLATLSFGSPGAEQGPKKFLVARNTRAAEMPDKTICLEVEIAPQIALHILLPGLLAEGTIQVLRQMLPEPGTRQ
jgi:hypothetical protein